MRVRKGERKNVVKMVEESIASEYVSGGASECVSGTERSEKIYSTCSRAPTFTRYPHGSSFSSISLFSLSPLLLLPPSV